MWDCTNSRNVAPLGEAGFAESYRCSGLNGGYRVPTGVCESHEGGTSPVSEAQHAGRQDEGPACVQGPHGSHATPMGSDREPVIA